MPDGLRRRTLKFWKPAITTRRFAASRSPTRKMALDAVVDPYFKGFSNIVYKLDTEWRNRDRARRRRFAHDRRFPTTCSQGRPVLRRGSAGRTAASRIRGRSLMSRWSSGGCSGRKACGARVRLSWLLPTSMYAEAMVSVFQQHGGTTSASALPSRRKFTGGEPSTIGRCNDLSRTC